MANIKFFRKDVAPSNPQEGYIWFNSSNNTIQLYKSGAWEVYTGKINDVTYADGKLTIVPHVGDSTTIDLGAVTNISDLSTRLGTLETNFNTLSGEFATEKGKISTLEGEMTTVKTEVAKLSDITGKVGAYVIEQFRLHDEARAEIDGGFESRISTLETGQTTLDGKIDGVQSTLQGAINTEKGRIDTLVGSDSGSIRDIAIDVLTETLVKDGASEAYDTLQEVSEWIKNHPEDAATMNSNISTNTTNIATLTGKVEALEAIDHEAYKAADTALETSLKGYVDEGFTAVTNGLNGAITAAFNQAKTDSKTYTDELANGAVATNTSDIADLKTAVETINTTIEENELTVASALTDLDTRINSLASGTVSSVSGENHIYVETTDGAVIISAVTGTVASGAATLAVASDVKAYVDNA